MACQCQKDVKSIQIVSSFLYHTKSSQLQHLGQTSVFASYSKGWNQKGRRGIYAFQRKHTNTPSNDSVLTANTGTRAAHLLNVLMLCGDSTNASLFDEPGKQNATSVCAVR